MNDINEILAHLKQTTAFADSNKKWDFYKKYPYSISSIVEKLKPEFDKQVAAERTHKKYFWNNKSEYYQKSVEEILTMWENKSAVGRMNGKVLDHFIGMILEDNATSEEITKYMGTLEHAALNKCKMWLRFYDQYLGPNAGENKIEFLGRELCMCDDKYGVNGRLDALFGFKNNILVIDWKNTENISTKCPFENMNGPLYKYEKTDLNSYTMQLYGYVYMLRTDYGLTINQIIPLLVQVGMYSMYTYSPVIPYSDSLVQECFAYAIEKIDEERKAKKVSGEAVMDK